MQLDRISDVEWKIRQQAGMRVPGRVYASEPLLLKAGEDQALQQVANVAYLPGIVGASYAMPDIHWGYGFPIGGVAATDVDEGGVVSPGGVGFDICCGVRLLRSHLNGADFDRHRDTIMGELSDRIPRGLGRGRIAGKRMLDDVLLRGAAAAVAEGFGTEADLHRCEENGTSDGARPDWVGKRAQERGSGQLGSLGSGNHFLEVQVVDRIFDEEAAAAFGLTTGMVAVMIHCGSRGLGHQVCQDQLQDMVKSPSTVPVPDRQLACQPVLSPEGERYLGAMAAAANFAWANRHILGHEARSCFAAALGTDPDELGMDLVFDVAHNLAKLETHHTAAGPRRLCVHRKGATRAWGPGHADLPGELQPVGQPVLVPGSMGTASWVLCGVAGNPAFASAAHGAGRVMSRRKAKRRESGRDVRDKLERSGIAVRPGSVGLLSEEAPYAYKDVDAVVDVCAEAGLAKKVARLRPLGVVKG